jgi:hypothetical protein
MFLNGSSFEDLFQPEVIIVLLVSEHQELAAKQKPPTHQSGGFANPPLRFHSASFLAAHQREVFISGLKGTLALHCQVVRLVSESLLMSIRLYRD